MRKTVFNFFVFSLVGAALLFGGCKNGDFGAYLDVPTVIEQAYTAEKEGCLIEIPQIVNSKRKAATCINDEIQELTEKMQDTYCGDEVEWCRVTAWPTETERYLSIVLRIEVFPSYGTNGEVISWVYDKQNGQSVGLAEALAMADTDESVIATDIGIWCTDNGYIKMKEGLECLAFRMTGEGTPQFIASVSTVEKALVEEIDPWSGFFTYTKGVVERPYDYPFDPAEVTGSYTHVLWCQNVEDSMGQYGGDAAIMSEDEALELFKDIYEIEKYLDMGMSVIFDGTTVEINGETCICAVLGTNGEDTFKAEAYYAATWGCAYVMDPVTGEWSPVGFG